MKIKINMIIILLLLIVTTVVTNMSFGSNAAPPKVNIKDRIPLAVNGYEAEEGEIPEKVYSLINPEEIIMRAYKSGDNVINLAAVVSENRDNLHAPEICYKLQGFQFKQEKPFMLNGCCKISKVDTIRQDKPYIFHFYYTDMEKVYTNRTDFVKNLVISKIMNEPRKKYALVIAFSEVSNEADLVEFSEKVVNMVLNKNL